MLSLFYITFSTVAIPGVMLTRMIGPRWTIPGYMIGWGTMAMINAGCKDFAGTVVVRLSKLLPQGSILMSKSIVASRSANRQPVCSSWSL